MKVVDWMIAARDKKRKPVAFWDGERWVRIAELGKPYYSEKEARQVMARLVVPEGASSVGLVEYQSEIE